MPISDLLTVIDANKRQSLVDLARQVGWFLSNGQPNKLKVYRALKHLKMEGLVDDSRHGRKVRYSLKLTTKGQEFLAEKHRLQGAKIVSFRVETIFDTKTS